MLPPDRGERHRRWCQFPSDRCYETSVLFLLMLVKGEVIGHIAAERQRDGASAWGIFEDTASPVRLVGR